MTADIFELERDKPYRCVVCKGIKDPSLVIPNGTRDWICIGCEYSIEHNLDPLSSDNHQRAYAARKKD